MMTIRQGIALLAAGAFVTFGLWIGLSTPISDEDQGKSAAKPVSKDPAQPIRLVGAFYFYWYKYPDEHFYNDAERTSDALTHHFPNPKYVDYESAGWHSGQLTDAAWAGLDFILPVFWGSAGAPSQRQTAFSIPGLDAIQSARDEMVNRHEPCPLIGMFYDTQTFVNAFRGVEPHLGKADLTTSEGQQLFSDTVRLYWRRLKRDNWATWHGRPIVVLGNSSFANQYDQRFLEFASTAFEREFNVRPLIIAEESWHGIKPDRFYRWGAAYEGPHLNGDVGSIGPGYDESAIPGRNAPIRDREDGRFYEYSWGKALKSDCKILLIETWNEMHEGSEICRSVESGDQYLRITREYVPLFKAGAASTKTIELHHPRPIDRLAKPSLSSDVVSSASIQTDFGSDRKTGIIAVLSADGLWETTTTMGRTCVCSAPTNETFLYFRASDSFIPARNREVILTVEYLDSGFREATLEYDSTDATAPLGGIYKRSGGFSGGNSGQWKAKEYQLHDASFSHRQNSGADFRIAVKDGPLCVRSIMARRMEIPAINNP